MSEAPTAVYRVLRMAVHDRFASASNTLRDAVIAGGVKIANLNFWVKGALAARVPFAITTNGGAVSLTAPAIRGSR
mgnify:CR=1 FL=1